MVLSLEILVAQRANNIKQFVLFQGAMRTLISYLESLYVQPCFEVKLFKRSRKLVLVACSYNSLGFLPKIETVRLTLTLNLIVLFFPLFNPIPIYTTVPL